MQAEQKEERDGAEAVAEPETAPAAAEPEAVVEEVAPDPTAGLDVKLAELKATILRTRLHGI